MGDPQSPLTCSRAPAKATFVLVHGAWHGGWGWKKVAERLRAIGHDVFTPTLTGLGERAHLLAPDIDLTTHIEDVLGVLEYEDLVNVVLVGHSYGGMVIAGVADRAPSRIATLVYLDAFFPETGKALRDYLPGDALDEMVSSQGDGWRLPSPWNAKDFGVTDEEDAAWANARIGDQPYKTFTQPLEFAASFNDDMRGAYIRTSQDSYVSHAARAREHGFDYFELLTAGHNSMMTQPAELVEVLLTIAGKHPQS
jgi:pimeloyl-ACP methyl ester carboxylesterase